MNGFAIGGFMSGLNKGIDTGIKIDGIMQKGKERGALGDAKDAATAARTAEIDGIMGGGEVNTDFDKGWNIDGKNYANEADARKAAEGKVGSESDFYYKVAVPKMAEFYATNGDMDKSEAFLEKAKTREAEKAYKTWNKGFKALQTQDVEGLASFLVDAHGNYNDGRTILKDKSKPVYGKNGQYEGINLVYKDDKTGEETTQLFDSRSIVSMGESYLSEFNPVNQISAMISRQDSADKMQAQANMKSQEGNLKFNRDLAISDRKHGQTLERDSANNASRRETAIVRQGLSDKRYAQRQREEAIKLLRTSSFGFDGKPPEEQEAQIQKVLQQFKGPNSAKPAADYGVDLTQESAPQYPGGASYPARPAGGKSEIQFNEQTGEYRVLMPDGKTYKSDKNGNPIK